MLDKILSARSCLSPAERKVADQVLDDPELCVGASIQRLAQLAGVSDPTVLRFCRAIGCKGYHDFKIRMAQSIASQDKFFFRDVSAGDTTPGTHCQAGRFCNGVDAEYSKSAQP